MLTAVVIAVNLCRYSTIIIVLIYVNIMHTFKL